MVAEKEYIVENNATRSLFAKTGSEDKEIVEFKDSFHELQKEPNKDEVHAKVLEFMSR